MKLIDADKLMENKFKNDISYNAFCNLVKRQPSIDAVQVIRCKDCIHSTSQVSDDEDNYYCNAMMRCMHSLEYCSHGERKES